MAEVSPFGSDHAGYQLKERFIEELQVLGYQPPDLGTRSPDSTGRSRRVEKIDRGNG